MLDRRREAGRGGSAGRQEPRLPLNRSHDGHEGHDQDPRSSLPYNQSDDGDEDVLLTYDVLKGVDGPHGGWTPPGRISKVDPSFGFKPYPEGYSARGRVSRRSQSTLPAQQP